jgi:hypothetical protein
VSTAPKLAAVQPIGSRLFERHFSAAELAELWGLSENSIRRMFEDEPGVLIMDTSSSTRRHRTLRIPQSVAERVYTRLSTRQHCQRTRIGV